MKSIKKIISFLLMTAIIMFPLSVYAATDRVICQVEVLSEQSASIHLRWLDPTNKTPIRITSWSLIDESTLKVSYIAGKDVISGWDTKKIEGSNYDFPMKVFLEEDTVESIKFKDIPTGIEEKNSILNLYYRGIISGYPDGTFKPSNLVTRAEFSKMVAETAQYLLLQNQTAKFKDVTATHWAFNYIMTLADKEILKGKAVDKFDPEGKVTLGEAIAIVNRTFLVYGEGTTYSGALKAHWSNEDFLTAVETGIVKSTDRYYNPFTPDQSATRVQCAVLLSRILEEIADKKVD